MVHANALQMLLKSKAGLSKLKLIIGALWFQRVFGQVFGSHTVILLLHAFSVLLNVLLFSVFFFSLETHCHSNETKITVKIRN